MKLFIDEAYDRGEYDKIKDYCMDDVAKLREIYNRISGYI